MAAPTFKSFVSEKEIEEVKKKRQEEWEKVRRPDQPLERPEEEYDARTLYERLKEQKDKKQEEWEEQFKFKNMIYKGLDDEEAGFLTFVAQQQADHKALVRKQEKKELSEFREAVAKVRDEAELSTPQTLTPPDLVDDTPTSGTSQKSESSAPPKSQMALLAGSIKTKRKRSTSGSKKDEVTSPEKKQRLSSSIGDSEETNEERGRNVEQERKDAPEASQGSKETEQSSAETGLGALSGLATYSSSDSSDTED